MNYSRKIFGYVFGIDENHFYFHREQSKKLSPMASVDESLRVIQERKRKSMSQMTELEDYVETYNNRGIKKQ